MIVQKRKEGKRKGETKQLVVTVPACWKFLKKVERLRDQTDTEDICELLAHWDYINLLSYGGLVFEENVTEPKVTTKAYLAYISYLRTMAEESLRMISQALERLTVNQTTTTWSRHMKTPDLFKPETRDQEIKQWSD